MAAVNPLLAAAANVDVLSAAGRIIDNPQRHAPSATTAEVLALAHGVRRLWDLCLLAERMTIAATAEPLEDDTAAVLQEDLAGDLIDAFCDEMAAVRGVPQTEET